MTETTTKDVGLDHAFMQLEPDIYDLVRAVELGRLTIKDETDGLLMFAFDDIESRAETLKKKYYELSRS